jgi:hypothetical protein
MENVNETVANETVTQQPTTTTAPKASKKRAPKDTEIKSKGTSKKDAEARRLLRNKKSREWKKANRTKVKTWNKAWAIETYDGDKKAADAMRAKVRGENANKYDFKDGQLVAKKTRTKKEKPAVQTGDVQAA